MEAHGFVNFKFIAFLKTTVAKMVATNTLGPEFLGLHFWQTWAKKIYNIKSFDCKDDSPNISEKTGKEDSTDSNNAQDTIAETQTVDNDDQFGDADTQASNSQSILAIPVK